jgi:uncharacterized protein YbjT (DUF2867 family)
MTRTPERADLLRELGAEVVFGDLRGNASLRSACDGVTDIIASAHAAMGGGANNPQTVDREGHRRLIDAARSVGAARFVYVSASGTGPKHPIEFFRIKYETERYLQASGLAYTIIRGSAFIETWIDILDRMLAKRGRVIIFGPGENPWNFVSADDVARVVVQALDSEDALNQTFDVLGPERLSMREVLGVLESVRGRLIRRTYVPVPVLHLLSWAVRPFNPVAHRVLAMGILMNRESESLSAAAPPFALEPSRFEDVVRRRLSEGGRAT